MEVAELAEEILQKLGSLKPNRWDKLLFFGDEIREEVANLRDDIDFIRAKHLDDAASSHIGRIEGECRKQYILFLYQIDDLIDDISTETAKARQMQQEIKSCHMFFASPLENFRLARQVRDIRCRFRELAMNQLLFADFSGRFFEVQEVKTVRRREETCSYVYADDIIGRDENTNAIAQMLFSGGERVSVIPILGMVGIGKTSLAQLVYNLDSVKQHFDLRVWVRSGHHFDLHDTIGSIVEATSTSRERVKASLDVEQLQMRLRETIRGKSYLLVLDDVWSIDHDKWLKFKNLLSAAGAPGSKIIITTRSEEVAVTMGTTAGPYRLEPLSDDDAWCLFNRIAFNNAATQEASPELVEIGKQIVKNVGNVPLFIRSLGSLLYGQSKAKLLAVAARMELPEQGAGYVDLVLPIMKLTYDNLPFHLKRCFAYCALFPRDYEIDKHQLVHLWIAQGFIQHPLEFPHQTLEDAGDQCFVDLLSWFLFKDVTRDGQGNRSFKMEDSAYNLAQSVARTETMAIVGDFSAGTVTDTFFHFFLDGNSNSLMKSSVSSMPPHLRSFLKRPGSTVHLTKSCCDRIFKHLRRLRVLDLHASNITVVPTSIGSLKHLRYLNLSDNPFKLLPDSITKLTNLQVLDVSSCNELQRLPTLLRRLVSLRHLYLGGCEKLTGMPVGLGQMTSLKTLSHFVLGKGKNSCKLDELGSLNLRAELTIVFANAKH